MPDKVRVDFLEQLVRLCDVGPEAGSSSAARVCRSWALLNESNNCLSSGVLMLARYCARRLFV
jgi:hypothetical protein